MGRLLLFLGQGDDARSVKKPPRSRK